MFPEIDAVFDTLTDEQRATLLTRRERTVREVFFGTHDFLSKNSKHLWSLNRKDQRFAVLAMMFKDQEADVGLPRALTPASALTGKK